MEKTIEGCFAISKAGHDKGRLYVIVMEDNEYIYVADGKLKLLERPKKKNKRHIQIIKMKAVDLLQGEDGVDSGACATNEQIKRAIKLYR